MPKTAHLLTRKRSPLALYWICWLLLWIPAVWSLWQLGYEGSFLAWHQWRHPWLDLIMPHLTHLADGLILAAGMGWLLRKQSAGWWTLMATMILVLVVVGIAKAWLFADWFRPALVLQENPDLHHISMKPLLYRSFPSGHATAAAAAAAIPAFVFGEKYPWATISLALLAIILAFTRVYIGVHFLGDIVAGGFLGIILAHASYLGLHTRLQVLFDNSSLLTQRRLLLTQTLISLIMLVVGIWGVWDRYYIG